MKINKTKDKFIVEKDGVYFSLTKNQVKELIPLLYQCIIEEQPSVSNLLMSYIDGVEVSHYLTQLVDSGNFNEQQCLAFCQANLIIDTLRHEIETKQNKTTQNNTHQVGNQMYNPSNLHLLTDTEINKAMALIHDSKAVDDLYIIPNHPDLKLLDFVHDQNLQEALLLEYENRTTVSRTFITG